MKPLLTLVLAAVLTSTGFSAPTIDASSKAACDMARRFLDAYAAGDAATVTGLLSAKSQHDLRKSVDTAMSLRTPGKESDEHLRKVFGTVDVASLGDAEVVGKMFEAAFAKHPGLSYVVLAGVLDNESDAFFVVCKWRVDDGSGPLIVEVTPEGEEKGVTATRELLNIASDFADGI